MFRFRWSFAFRVQPRIGNEQIGEHARGGLGRVVRAIDKRLGRTVAVKELLHHDESHEARFVR